MPAGTVCLLHLDRPAATHCTCLPFTMGMVRAQIQTDPDTKRLPLHIHHPPCISVDVTSVVFNNVWIVTMCGPGGASVSEHCSKKLHDYLRKAVTSQLHLEQKTKGRGRRLSSDTPPSPPSLVGALPMEGVQAALVEAFLSIDKELLKKGSAKDKGTTAVVALLGQNHIWVANCGEGELGKLPFLKA